MIHRMAMRQMGVRFGGRPSLAASLLASLAVLPAAPALAQSAQGSAPAAATEQPTQTTGADAPQAATAPTATSPTSAAPAAAPTLHDTHGRDPAKFKRFDQYREQGTTTNWPGSIDSVLGDAGGIRSFLADHDAYFESRFGTVVSYNPLDTGQPYEPQRYNGQRFTVQTNSLNLIVTVGLQSIGLPNSRITVGGNYLITTFVPNGPNNVTFRNLTYYQSFANKKIELKFGLMPNYYEFVGLFVGGSPVLSTGVSGLIPIQAGLSADPAESLAANLTFNFKHGVYFKTGVQRSINPRGSVYEVQNHDYGLAFSTPGAGPLYIGELGLRRAATAGSHQIWLRAGGFYNDSAYTRFDGRGTRAEQTAYAAGDYQFVQSDPTHPAQGIYAGVSAFWAPQQVTSYTQSYEGRVYDIGLIPSRPTDTATLRVGYIKYSPDAIAANQRRGLYANDHQFSITGSYAWHMALGVYFTPAVSYISHPSLVGNFKDAVNLSASLQFLL